MTQVTFHSQRNSNRKSENIFRPNLRRCVTHKQLQLKEETLNHLLTTLIESITAQTSSPRQQIPPSVLSSILDQSRAQLHGTMISPTSPENKQWTADFGYLSSLQSYLLKQLMELTGHVGHATVKRGKGIGDEKLVIKQLFDFSYFFMVCCKKERKKGKKGKGKEKDPHSFSSLICHFWTVSSNFSSVLFCWNHMVVWSVVMLMCVLTCECGAVWCWA